MAERWDVDLDFAGGACFVELGERRIKVTPRSNTPRGIAEAHRVCYGLQAQLSGEAPATSLDFEP